MFVERERKILSRIVVKVLAMASVYYNFTALAQFYGLVFKLFYYTKLMHKYYFLTGVTGWFIDKSFFIKNLIQYNIY